MADSLENDFALSDVESIGSGSGEVLDARPAAISKRKSERIDEDANVEELTEAERRAKKKRKLKEQDKKRKQKVSDHSYFATTACQVH